MDMQSLLGVLAVTVNPAVGNAEMQQAERQLNQVQTKDRCGLGRVAARHAHSHTQRSY